MKIRRHCRSQRSLLGRPFVGRRPLQSTENQKSDRSTLAALASGSASTDPLLNGAYVYEAGRLVYFPPGGRDPPLSAFSTGSARS